MAFENISKGDFESKNGFITTEKTLVCLVYLGDEERQQNMSFIQFCFNLQQKYDISKFEECVKALEQIWFLHYDPTKRNKHNINHIEQLLKEVKK